MSETIAYFPDRLGFSQASRIGLGSGKKSGFNQARDKNRWTSRDERPSALGIN
jgi:hypothetical protein